MRLLSNRAAPEGDSLLSYDQHWLKEQNYN